MTKTEHARLTAILKQADTLLNSNTASGITNMDVMEAILGDITNVLAAKGPTHLAALITLDEANA